MMPQNSKMLIGALVAAALAIAVFYGVIGQQTATNIQTQTDSTLGTGPVSQQPAQTAPQTGTTQSPTPQPNAQTPRQ